MVLPAIALSLVYLSLPAQLACVCLGKCALIRECVYICFQMCKSKGAISPVWFLTQTLFMKATHVLPVNLIYISACWILFHHTPDVFIYIYFRTQARLETSRLEHLCTLTIFTLPWMPEKNSHQEEYSASTCDQILWGGGGCTQEGDS